MSESWARTNTNIEAYVFLDENRNGVADPSETARVGSVSVHVLNATGATIARV